MAIWVDIGSLEVDGEGGGDEREGDCGFVIKKRVPKGRSGGGGIQPFSESVLLLLRLRLLVVAPLVGMGSPM